MRMVEVSRNDANALTLMTARYDIQRERDQRMEGREIEEQIEIWKAEQERIAAIDYALDEWSKGNDCMIAKLKGDTEDHGDIELPPKLKAAQGARNNAMLQSSMNAFNQKQTASMAKLSGMLQQIPSGGLISSPTLIWAIDPATGKPTP